MMILEAISPEATVADVQVCVLNFFWQPKTYFCRMGLLLYFNFCACVFCVGRIRE